MVDLKKLYPTMGKPDGRATKRDGMYPTMKAQQRLQAASESKAVKAHREGWRRTEPHHLAALKRFTGMAGRYDIQFDNPEDPTEGGWIRQREPKEGLVDHGLKSETGNY